MAYFILFFSEPLNQASEQVLCSP